MGQVVTIGDNMVMVCMIRLTLVYFDNSILDYLTIILASGGDF